MNSIDQTIGALQRNHEQYTDDKFKEQAEKINSIIHDKFKEQAAEMDSIKSTVGNLQRDIKTILHALEDKT